MRIWYEDGSSVGFFSGDSPQIRSDIGHDKSEYQCESKKYSDDEVKDAVEKLRPKWEGTYDFFASRHCQSFAKAVKDEINPAKKTSRGKRRPR